MTTIVMGSLEGVSIDRKKAEQYKCCANCGKLYGHQSLKNWYEWDKEESGEPRIHDSDHVEFGGHCQSNNKKAKKVFGFKPIGAPNSCPSWTCMGDERAIGKLRLHDYRK